MSDIELIKSKLDIVDIIQSYLPTLKRAGSNYKANCPFHKEKTPSFMVNPQLQIFKCFGCGKAGDVITFIQEIEKLDFTDALKFAAEKAGVQIRNTAHESSKEKKERDDLIRANNLAAKFYHYILQSHESGKSGREYAQKRKIDSARIEQFMVGFAPRSRENLKKFLSSKGFDAKDLERWGLLVERNGMLVDKFRERLMQPIFNLKGEVVGFSGRYIGTSKEAPKYLNSPETLVYKKNELLYGLYQAREFLKKQEIFDTDFLILEEGNIDILSSHRVGVGNIVAPLGTAFTQNQAKLIKRFVDTVYFCFDTDEAGTKALIRSLGIAENIELKHKVIDITGFQDPDDLICKNPDQWIEKVNSAVNTVDYLITRLSKDLDLGSLDGKTKFSEEIIPILGVLKNEIELTHYAKKIAGMIDVDNEVIINKIKKHQSLNRGDIQHLDQISIQSVFKQNYSIPTEMYFLSLILQNSQVPEIKIDEEIFVVKECQEIFAKFKNDPTIIHVELAKTLEENTRKVYEDILLIDISEITDLEKELKSVYRRLYKDYLNREIKRLGKLINESDDNDEPAKKINELLVKMRELK